MALNNLRSALRTRLRKMRGAIGLGVAWAAGWAPIGAVVGLVLGTVGSAPPGVGLWSVVGINTASFAAPGFVGGGLFSTVLTLAEGSRRFDELSLPRFGGWGAMGGLVLGGLSAALVMWGPGLVALKIGAATVLGAASATASLALARRADDQALLEAHEDASDLGPSDDESRRMPRGMA